MPYVAVTADVWVDPKELDIEDVDTETLAKELVRRADWEKAISAARQGRDDVPLYNLECEVQAMIEKAMLSRSIADDLRDIAWRHFGRCL